MKAIAINGSPRKNGSTSILLQEALRKVGREGAGKSVSTIIFTAI